jgi:hypothetical protein
LTFDLHELSPRKISNSGLWGQPVVRIDVDTT